MKRVINWEMYQDGESVVIHRNVDAALVYGQPHKQEFFELSAFEKAVTAQDLLDRYWEHSELYRDFMEHVLEMFKEESGAKSGERRVVFEYEE